MFFKMRHHQFYNFSFVLTFASLSILGITLANDATNSDENPGYKLCTSQICEEAGNEIIQSIDHSVKPCDDFYKHACGGWIKNHPIPENLDVASQLNVLAMKSQKQLREMLQNNEEPDSEVFRKVRDFYRSCNNLAAIDAKGWTPLKEIVLANGGWPVTLPPDNWHLQQNKLTLEKIHNNYAKVAAAYAIFAIDVYPDLLNSSVEILRLGSPMDPLYRPRWFVPPRIKRNTGDLNYTNYIVAVAEKFARSRGSNVTLDNIKDDVVQMIKFQDSLNELYSLDAENNTKISYRVTTIAEVQNTWNSAISGHLEYTINWLETIRSAFEGTDIVIDSTEKIGLTPGNIVEKLAELLKKNSLRTVVNYVHWHAIDNLLPYTNKEMRDVVNGFMIHHYGYEDNDNDRSIACVGQHKIRHGLSYVYVKKYIEQPLTTVIDMVSQIQAEMKRKFDESTWLDDEEKIRSKEKVDNMVTNVGYPSWYDEPGKIGEYYRDLKVDSDYFENILNYNRFKRTTKMKKLREPYDRYNAEWEYEPIVIHGFYTAIRNSITLAAVNFQMPIFHAQRPLVMNYGSIGSFIGHEISHAFDNEGRMYDKVGNKKQWWSNSTIAKFNEKAECFVDQYNKYKLFENNYNEPLYVNGRTTLQENIGDNSGFMISLKAYLSHKKDHNLEDIRIPVLKNYTDEQLFFYSLSNYFCASERPEMTIHTGKHGTHSPFAVRIKGVLSNMPEFSEAFNCPSGSPMNPVKKCILWD